MLNVNPYEIHYTKISKSGVLAGIPHECHFGVESIEDGKHRFEQMITNSPNDTFSNFYITERGNPTPVVDNR